MNLFLRTLLGNLGNVGNLGNPGNLGEPWGGMGFGAAPVCSETFTMAEDPKASAVGEKLAEFLEESSKTHHQFPAAEGFQAKRISDSCDSSVLSTSHGVFSVKWVKLR